MCDISGNGKKINENDNTLNIHYMENNEILISASLSFCWLAAYPFNTNSLVSPIAFFCFVSLKWHTCEGNFYYKCSLNRGNVCYLEQTFISHR